MSWIEVLGFVSGGISVWLYVRQSVWAWPVGILNSGCWFALLWGAGLFLNAVLQVLYVVLAGWGWYWWLRGGPASGGGGRGELAVRRTRPREAAGLAAGAVVATAGLWWLMRRQGDVMPFWDAATTVVSLIAQYLLTRKLLDTWWCWIAVDVAYVVMYSVQGLYLTAALQPLFIAMCVLGIRQWRASMAEDARRVAGLPPAGAPAVAA